MIQENPPRDPVEVLATEFVERRRRGEHPSVDEYAERYPQWSDQIRSLFPTMVAVERWKTQQERAVDGRASLVPRIAIVSPPRPRLHHFAGGLPSFPSRLGGVWSSRR